ncbi:MAG TPA: nucleoside transporter C-terminal domain-containing protein [Steroidobacteraceae bacterium]|nr:nucleoside transporter C-terminal domain-containing protein [Steroidobacteraceae bacterium]
MPLQLQSALGVIVLRLLVWLLSERRRLISWRFVVIGTLVQIGLAALFLKLPISGAVFAGVNTVVVGIQHASEAGSSFVFGFLGGGPLPYQETRPGTSVALAFRILPLLIIMSAVASLLIYWRVLPAIVRGFAWVFEKSLGIGGAVSVSSATNIFLGMVESAILIRPYIARLTRSELFIVMTVGLGGVAGTVLVLYASMLAHTVPNAAGHLLVATLITVPSSIVIARMMVPETGTPTPGELAHDEHVHGSIEALMQGTRQGLELFLNVVAILIVFVALVYLVDGLLALLPGPGGSALSLERVGGWMFAPIAWLMGVPWHEAPVMGALLGTKTVLNELIAYRDLAALQPSLLSERGRLLTTYALCGFANFGSVAILVAGLATMAPTRRAEISKLGLRALVGGMIANCSTAAVVGMLV